MYSSFQHFDKEFLFTAFINDWRKRDVKILKTNTSLTAMTHIHHSAVIIQMVWNIRLLGGSGTQTGGRISVCKISNYFIIVRLGILLNL